MNPPKPSLSLIEIPMYIGGVLYILIGFAVIAFAFFLVNSGEADQIAGFVTAVMGFSAIFSFALGFFFIYATTQLKHRKKWAWITAVVVGAMYTPSAFIFLGVPILIGCFNSEVNAWFNGNHSPAKYQTPYPPQQPATPYETNDPYQPPRQ